MAVCFSWTHDGVWDRAQTSDRSAQAIAGRSTHGIEKWMAYDPLEWTLHDAWCGHGFATEIGREACVAFDELGAGQVVAFTEPDYAGSRAVMKRLRLTYTREMCHEGAAFVLYTITRATHTALTPTPSLTREG